MQDLVARIDEALRFALRRHSSATVVFVGHNSGNRALLLKLLDQPLSAYWRLAQDPCCINKAEIVDGRLRWKRPSIHQRAVVSLRPQPQSSLADTAGGSARSGLMTPKRAGTCA